MALRVRKTPKNLTCRLSNAALIDLSLRNHLSLLALDSDFGTAFHLGTIIRTMFASFFLFDAGFGDGDASVYTDADQILGELAMNRSIDCRFALGPHAFQATARLLKHYDSQLWAAPLGELIAAHQRSECNFQESPERRLDIPALIQQSTRIRQESDRRSYLSPP
ncbi:hypothetical protein E1N52_33635 [Paraburkholderia guartelaensis]|uniref:Uncharacterized protein n=1 Tax=Paraburkholderia guartelaensis TaxID=2546446 RepID=A0A4R5L6N3_9BURK|nr:hypothetical protein [Paraburkholderia guartelaensis]TDG03572.1 hypothetical protein E1N52_33635 [Paraburkholderia guartelaensis]